MSKPYILLFLVHFFSVKSVVAILKASSAFALKDLKGMIKIQKLHYKNLCLLKMHPGPWNTEEPPYFFP